MAYCRKGGEIMKFCTRCGAELDDNAEVCSNCGCPTELFRPAQNVQQPQAAVSSHSSGLDTAIKVFMILGCIAAAFAFLIPLIWAIPMTVHAFRKINDGEPMGVGFKVCTLLFLNMIEGIRLLVRDA